MTTLGPSTDYTGASVTQGGKKTFIAAMRALIADRLGVGYNLAPENVASASNVDLSVINTRQINLTGSTQVDTVTAAVGFAVQVKATGSILLKAAVTAAQDILVHAGDTFTWRATAANTMEVIGLVRSAAAQTHPNGLLNSSFAVNNDVTSGTTDNSYILDGWRLLLESANAATAARDTTTVRAGGSGYALKLTVGAANNNKFGVWSVLKDRESAPYRGNVASLRIPLAATAGLTNGTGKIRAALLLWTGTLDSLSADPVSAWNAEGTNPTLIAGWAYASTPVALSVGTTFADFLIENQSVGSGTNNLAVMIWCDDKASTTTTDILRIGDSVMLTPTASAQPAVVEPLDVNRNRCARQYWHTYEDGVAFGTASATNCIEGYTSGGGGIGIRFPVQMDAAPTLTAYDPITPATARVYGDVDGSVTVNFNNTGRNSVFVAPNYSTSIQHFRFHLRANCRP